jgi:hypothetical protein
LDLTAALHAEGFVAVADGNGPVIFQVMMGRSGSPSRKLTITSWPTRVHGPPFVSGPALRYPDPARPVSARLLSRLRSQVKRTLTRPYISVWISSPSGPVGGSDALPSSAHPMVLI